MQLRPPSPHSLEVDGAEYPLILRGVDGAAFPLSGPLQEQGEPLRFVLNAGGTADHMRHLDVRVAACLRQVRDRPHCPPDAIEIRRPQPYVPTSGLGRLHLAAFAIARCAPGVARCPALLGARPRPEAFLANSPHAAVRASRTRRDHIAVFEANHDAIDLWSGVIARDVDVKRRNRVAVDRERHTLATGLYDQKRVCKVPAIARITSCLGGVDVQGKEIQVARHEPDECSGPPFPPGPQRVRITRTIFKRVGGEGTPGIRIAGKDPHTGLGIELREIGHRAVERARSLEQLKSGNRGRRAHAHTWSSTRQSCSAVIERPSARDVGNRGGLRGCRSQEKRRCSVRAEQTKKNAATEHEPVRLRRFPPAVRGRPCPTGGQAMCQTFTGLRGSSDVLRHSRRPVQV